MTEYREQTRAEWLHGLVDEQEKEIERLRERIEKLEQERLDHSQHSREEYDGLFAERERLRERIVPLCKEHIGTLGEGCVGCYIEELEKEREECVRQCPAPTIAQAAAMRNGQHFEIITTAQIDAARDRLKHLHRAANDQNVPGKIRQRFEAAAHAIKTALKEDFNIVIGGEDE